MANQREQQAEQFPINSYNPNLEQFQQMNLHQNQQGQLYQPFVFGTHTPSYPLNFQASVPFSSQNMFTPYDTTSSRFVFQPQSQVSSGFGFTPPPPPPPPPPLPPLPSQPIRAEASEIFLNPGRKTRPPLIAIIFRGPPGCGKSKMAKLFRDFEKEAESLGTRIHCLDDYFVTDDGYEYDASLEETYRDALLNAFTKTISKPNLHSLVIVDAVNADVSDYEQLYQVAQQAGYVPFIAPMGEMVGSTPEYMNVLDVSCFDENSSNQKEINEIDMEDCDIPITMQPRPPSPPVKSNKNSSGSVMDRWGDDVSDDDECVGVVDRRERCYSRESQGQRKRVRWCDEAPDGTIPSSAGPGLEDVRDVVEDRPPFEVGAVTVQRRRGNSDPSDLSVHFEERRKVVVKGMFASSPSNSENSPSASSSHEVSHCSPEGQGEEEYSDSGSFANRVREEQARYRQALQLKSFSTDDDDDDDDD